MAVTQLSLQLSLLEQQKEGALMPAEPHAGFMLRFGKELVRCQDGETMSLNVGRERMLMVEVYGRGESALSLGKVLETGTDEQMVPLLTMAKGARPAFMVRASMSARGGGIEPAAQPPSSAANSTAGGRHAGTGMPSAFASSTGPAWASLAGAASMRVSSDSSRGAAATCLESSASLPAYPTAPTSIAPLPCYYIGGWELLHSDIVTVTSGSVGEAGGGAVSNISGISA